MFKKFVALYMACICRLSAMAAHSALSSVKRLGVGLASVVQTAISTQANLINRSAFSLGLIIFMLSSAQSNASCTVNGVSYKTNSAASGNYITLVDLKNGTMAWNNSTDLVTTCDVSLFTSMNGLFKFNSTFDQDLSAWDTSAVKDMGYIGYMFYGATSLTSVSLPKIGAVTTMANMFQSASAFNQDIRGWDVTSVKVFNQMFTSATAMISKFGSTPNWNTTPTSAWFVVPDTTAPTVTLTGPSGIVTADFTVTATFSEVVTGLEVITVPVSEGTVTGLSGSGAVYTITVSPILGQTVNVSIAANKAKDAAGNLNTASNTLSISAGSPASEFANHKATIKNVITGEMSRALRSSIASDQRMGRKSLTRFIAAQSGSDANQDVAFFVDGNAELKVTQADLVISTQGGFLSQKTTGDGTWRKLAFGDFDVQTDDKKNVSGFSKWQNGV